MPSCAVFGCMNSNRKTRGSGIRYYSFPGQQTFRMAWLNACKRTDDVNLKHATICSEHFEADCFFTTLRHSLLNYSPSNFRNLKPDAIPTLKLPNKKCEKDILKALERTERCKRRQNRKTCDEILNNFKVSSITLKNFKSGSETPNQSHSQLVPVTIKNTRSPNIKDNELSEETWEDKKNQNSILRFPVKTEVNSDDSIYDSCHEKNENSSFNNMETDIVANSNDHYNLETHNSFEDYLITDGSTILKTQNLASEHLNGLTNCFKDKNSTNDELNRDGKLLLKLSLPRKTRRRKCSAIDLAKYNKKCGGREIKNNNMEENKAENSDKQFLLSLLPAMESMTSSIKEEFKTCVLSEVKRLSNLDSVKIDDTSNIPNITTTKTVTSPSSSGNLMMLSFKLPAQNIGLVNIGNVMPVQSRLASIIPGNRIVMIPQQIKNITSDTINIQQTDPLIITTNDILSKQSKGPNCVSTLKIGEVYSQKDMHIKTRQINNSKTNCKADMLKVQAISQEIKDISPVKSNLSDENACKSNLEKQNEKCDFVNNESYINQVMIDEIKLEPVEEIILEPYIKEEPSHLTDPINETR